MSVYGVLVAEDAIFVPVKYDDRRVKRPVTTFKDISP